MSGTMKTLLSQKCHDDIKSCILKLKMSFGHKMCHRDKLVPLRNSESGVLTSNIIFWNKKGHYDFNSALVKKVLSWNKNCYKWLHEVKSDMKKKNFHHEIKRDIVKRKVTWWNKKCYYWRQLPLWNNSALVTGHYKTLHCNTFDAINYFSLQNYVSI